MKRATSVASTPATMKIPTRASLMSARGGTACLSSASEGPELVR